MKDKKIIAIILLVIISTISVLSVDIKRNAVERKNNTIEFIMEYSEVKQIANNSENNISKWLSDFKDMGVQSIAVGEQTLSSYMTEYGITYDSYLEIKNRGNDIFAKDEDLKDYGKESLVLYILEQDRAEFLSKSLNFYEDIEHKLILGEDTNYIVINQNENDVLLEETGDTFNQIGQDLGTTRVYYGTEVLNVPIGFDEYKVNLIKDANLEAILRPVNYDLDGLGAWNLYLSEIEKYGLSSKLLFPWGDQLIGYEENGGYIDLVYDYILDNDLNFAVVETIEQREHYELDGYDKLFGKLEKDKVVRVFNSWSFISNRFQYLNKYEGAEEIANSYYRAITERNIRAIYLRNFNSDNIRIVTDPVEYEKMFHNLEPRLEKHGYYLGNATTFEDYEVSTPMKVLLTIEVVAFLIVLLNYLLLPVKAKYNIILLCIGGLLVSAAYFVAPNASTTLSAFFAAITFSTLATTVYIKECLIDVKYNTIVKAGLFTIASGFIATLGGLYVGALMASTSYFLEFEYFRGVKLSVLLPTLFIGIFTIVFYVKEIYRQKGSGFFDELKTTTNDVLDLNIKVKYLIILGVIGILGLLYIARGSNTSEVQPLDIELLMRNFLENNLLARPRTKEFLIAFPLMTFATFFAGNKYFYQNKTDNAIYFKYGYVLFFALVASIGLSSITNTFSHIRTPIYISVFRTFYGLALGVVFGYIYIIGFKVLIVIWNKIVKVLKKFTGDFLA